MEEFDFVVLRGCLTPNTSPGIYMISIITDKGFKVHRLYRNNGEKFSAISREVSCKHPGVSGNTTEVPGSSPKAFGRHPKVPVNYMEVPDKHPKDP